MCEWITLQWFLKMMSDVSYWIPVEVIVDWIDFRKIMTHCTLQKVTLI